MKRLLIPLFFAATAFAADSYISAPPETAGKRVQTALNTVNGVPVHSQGFFLVNTSGAPIATLPVSGALTISSGSITIANASLAVTQSGAWTVGVNNFPATQPVSLATNTPDITDRAGRLLGHITIDNASLAVTGTVTTNATLSAETTKVIGTINVAAGQTIATTNAGTFAVQAAQSGTWNIGSITTLPSIAGTVTANAGTNLNTSALALDATLAALTLSQGTSPSARLGPMVQGVAATAAPTWSNSEVRPLSINLAGGLRVDGSGVTQPVSLSTLPALTAGSAVIGHVIADTGSTTAVTGTVTANATLSAETTKVIGTVNVSAAQSITANAGTNLNTSALALDATVANLNVAQAAASTGKTGPMVQGITSAGAPTWSATEVHPLSLTQAGGLRIDGTGYTQPISGTVQPGNTANTTAWLVKLDQTGANNDVDVLTLPSITGTVTSNAGTNLNTSLLALESGGNLATVAGLSRAEDSASADADKGIALFGIRKATPANTSGTDGDYEALQLSAGRLWTSSTVDAALPTGTNTIGFVKETDGTTTATNATTGGRNVVMLTASGTAFASGSHGVATTNTDVTNTNNCKGIIVYQNLTVLGASSVATFKVQRKDPVSGVFVDILASAATGAGVNATGMYTLRIYPGIAATANIAASDILAGAIRIVSTVATAASTFSLSYELIP